MHCRAIIHGDLKPDNITIEKLGKQTSSILHNPGSHAPEFPELCDYKDQFGKLMNASHRKG